MSLFGQGGNQREIGENYNQSPFKRANDDPMQDMKRQHAEYLRLQIKQKEDQRFKEKQSYTSSQIPVYMNEASNYGAGNLANIGNEGDIFQNRQQANNREHGQYLKQQMQSKRKFNEKGFSSDTKASKIQQLQDKMAEKSDNPYGRGGGGAPLLDKNGEVISSRKPNPSTVRHDIPSDRSNVMGQQPMFQQGEYQSTLNWREPFVSVPSFLNEMPKNQKMLSLGFANQYTPVSDNRDYQRGSFAKQMESYGHQHSIQPFQVQKSESRIIFEKNGIRKHSFWQDKNFKRMNKRLLEVENEDEGEMLKKEKQKCDISQALREQMDAKERKKQEEKLRDKEEDMRIEERVRKERDQIQRELKEEEELKKNKILQIAQDNNNLRQQRKDGGKTNVQSQEKAIPHSSPYQQKPNKPVSSFSQMSSTFGVSPRNGGGGINYQFAQGYPAVSQQNIYPFVLPRMTLSSEQKNRNIIPELEGMKLQIQEQYKMIQIDMQRVKVENFQAIDDRNRQQSYGNRQFMQNPYGKEFGDFKAQPNLNLFSNSIGESGHANSRHQLSQQRISDQRSTSGDNKLQFLNGESKMIPMDLIDKLRSKDQLTMSKLMNYDQDTQQQSSERNINAILGLGNTGNNKWDLPQMDGGISFEIDKILDKQSQQVIQQQKKDDLNKHKHKNRSQNSSHKKNMKNETTFNLAAKGILDFRGQEENQTKISDFYQGSPNENDKNSHFNKENMKSQKQEQVISSTNRNPINSDLHQDFKLSNMILTNSDEYEQRNENQVDEENNHQGEKENSSIPFKKQSLMKNELHKSKDKLFEYKKSSKYDRQFTPEEEIDEDSDEIKKQKILREIKEKFNLSTVNEEQNEKSKILSTLLETGKYHENKELYESLRLVEDPDFFKLDDLIRQFKSTHFINNPSKSNSSH